MFSRQSSYSLMEDPKALLERLLPHRDPMVLLEEVVAIDNDSASTALQIRQSSPFYRQDLGGVPGWVGLEYMAQTISVWSGDQLLRRGKPIVIGFLLGSRHYQVRTAVFPLDARLITTIKAAYLEASGLSSFECSIRSQAAGGDQGEMGEILATARINAFRPEDFHAFSRHGYKVRGETE